MQLAMLQQALHGAESVSWLPNTPWKRLLHRLFKETEILPWLSSGRTPARNRIFIGRGGANIRHF